MKKDEIFFGNQGLTSTSANHISNMAKEFVSNLKEEINEIGVVNETLQLIGGETTPTKYGVDLEYFNSLSDKLNKISEAQSLIAWLREAIKARKNLISEVENMKRETFMEKNNLGELSKPVREDYLTEDDYISTLSIKERNRYYALETKCAVIGKYIHPDGHLQTLRKDALNALNKPTFVNANGRDTLIYKKEPTVKPYELDEVFFNLQKEHREAQAELNSIKYNMEKALLEDKTAKDAKYASEYEAYVNSVREIDNQIAIWTNSEIKRISSLKIIIPNELKNIYNEINSLGKAN